MEKVIIESFTLDHTKVIAPMYVSLGKNKGNTAILSPILMSAWPSQTKKKSLQGACIP